MFETLEHSWNMSFRMSTLVFNQYAFIHVSETKKIILGVSTPSTKNTAGVSTPRAGVCSSARTGLGWGVSQREWEKMSKCTLCPANHCPYHKLHFHQSNWSLLEKKDVVHYEKLIYVKCKAIKRIYSFFFFLKVYRKKIAKTNFLWKRGPQISFYNFFKC